MNKPLSYIFGVMLFFLLAVFMVPVEAFAAPRLYFDPSDVNAQKDSEVSLKIIIDAEAQSAFGADATITFNPGELQLVSVNKGDFFTDFGHAPTSGRIEMHGFFASVFDGKTGSGDFAILKFKFLKSSGDARINYECTGSGNDTQILNTQGTNILTCGVLNQYKVNFASSSGGSTATPTASPTTAATATPKPKTPTPKPTTKATPQVVVLAPFVSPTPEATITPVPEQSPVPGAETNAASQTIFVFVGLSVLLVGAAVLAFILYKKFKDKNKPPYIGLSDQPKTEAQNQPVPPTYQEPE